MWITTTSGYFSAVQHRDDPSLVVVRTRVKADARDLAARYERYRADQTVAAAARIPDAEVITTEFSDYPHRVIMPKDALAVFVGEDVLSIDYGNFKDAVKDRQGSSRAAAYSRVWSALLPLEDADPEGRPAPEYDGWEPPEDFNFAPYRD